MNNQEIKTISMDRREFKIISKDGEDMFWLTDKNTVMPSEIMEAIQNQTYNKELVKKWFQDDTFTDFEGLDEIRTEILSLLHGSYVEYVLNLKSICKSSGIELYKNNPIGLYIQQGDVILFQKGKNPRKEGNEMPDTVEFEDLEPAMKIRIESNVFYELLSGEYEIMDAKIPVKYLKMGNASFYNERADIHIEMVGSDCESIMDAIEFRNGVRMLPCQLS